MNKHLYSLMMGVDAPLQTLADFRSYCSDYGLTAYDNVDDAVINRILKQTSLVLSNLPWLGDVPHRHCRALRSVYTIKPDQKNIRKVVVTIPGIYSVIGGGDVAMIDENGLGYIEPGSYVIINELDSDLRCGTLRYDGYTKGEIHMTLDSFPESDVEKSSTCEMLLPIVAGCSTLPVTQSYSIPRPGMPLGNSTEGTRWFDLPKDIAVAFIIIAAAKLDAAIAAAAGIGTSATIADVPMKSVAIGDIKVEFGTTQTSSFTALRNAYPQLADAPDSALFLLEPYLTTSATKRCARFTVVS